MEVSALLFDGQATTLDGDGPPTVDVDTESDVFTTVEVDQIRPGDRARVVDHGNAATVMVAALQDEDLEPMDSVRDDYTDEVDTGHFSTATRSNATAFVVAALLFLLVLIVGVGVATYAVLVDTGTLSMASVQPASPAKPSAVPPKAPAPGAQPAGDAPKAAANPSEPVAAVIVPVEAPDAGSPGAAAVAAPAAEADAGRAPTMYDMVEVQTNTSAKVYLRGRAVGSTPLQLNRAKFGDKPLELELRSRGFHRKTVKVDWSEGIITANLRKNGRPGRDKSPPISDGGSNPRGVQTGKKGGSDGKTRKPALFDPGAGPSNNTKKPRDNPKLFN